MSYLIYIGVDDTDTLDSVGTGRVARGLASRFVELGLGESMGVGRHQLLVDPRIHYTSHNSSKSIAIKSDRRTANFFEPAVACMKEFYQPGSDPGICICDESQVSEEIMAFGQRAVTEVLTKKETTGIAARHGLFLRELGGNGSGIIGALAAVGLRSWGNEGRLVDLPGIHEIKGVISVRDVLARTPIFAVKDTAGNDLRETELIDSKGWLRPSLVHGRPILRVKQETNGTAHIWVDVERRFAEEGKKGGHDD